MPALIERPKMTKTMYQALKRHIMKEREKKKQEQEQDEAQERMKKEREQRKKKEQEDSMTLEQTKEQVTSNIRQQETKLDSLKKEKHELFSQLKKVLHQEDETRRRAQVKEQNELLSMSQHYNQTTGIPVSVSSHPMFLPANTPGITTGMPVPNRHQLYKPGHAQSQMHQMAGLQNRNYLVLQGMKRPRSPSPPPATIYQHYPETKYPPATYSQSKAYTPAQKHSHYQTAQAGHVTYVTQSQGYHQQQQQQAQQQQQQAQQAAAAQQQQQQQQQQQAAVQQQQQQSNYPTQSNASKYQANQSAFTSYPSHYAHQQKQITDHYPPGYAVQRMPAQSGYHPPHSASIPLQQQLEHASQKSGFSEEKYKMQQPAMRGMAPMSSQQQQMMPQQVQLQQQPQNKGSIVTGYPVRTQAQSSHSSSYQGSQSGYNQQNGAQRRPYHGSGQPPGHQGRYY
ncbi:G protein pathway suppressor 2-like isoform X2 [Lineus longissimus]|uniref:G protein pathway suppressor 2-like isoform X2 n=1 Tax=Lineus longissimus TaxID=88925 RepID=UPI00315CB4DB